MKGSHLVCPVCERHFYDPRYDHIPCAMKQLKDMTMKRVMDHEKEVVSRVRKAIIELEG